MKINIGKNDTLSSIQKRFQCVYPYLKLEFFKSPGEGHTSREKLPLTIAVQYASTLHAHAWVSIRNSRTVAKLEEDLCRKLGLNVQVMRRSGNLWIETNRTDSWTLEKQNEEGKASQAANSYEIEDKDLQDVS